MIWALMITVTFSNLVESAQGMWQEEPVTITYIDSLYPSERDCAAALMAFRPMHATGASECKATRIGDVAR